MDYPYIDYYKSNIDGMWHVVEHYGPNGRGTYTCNILAKAKTEKDVKEFLRLRKLKGGKRKNGKR